MDLATWVLFVLLVILFAPMCVLGLAFGARRAKRWLLGNEIPVEKVDTEEEPLHDDALGQLPPERVAATSHDDPARTLGRVPSGEEVARRPRTIPAPVSEPRPPRPITAQRTGITLELRRLWTASGDPELREFSDTNERDLRDLLSRLDEHGANPARPRAVLIATGDTGKLVGAWDRNGAAELVALLDAVPRSAELTELRNALLTGLEGS